MVWREAPEHLLGCLLPLVAAVATTMAPASLHMGTLVCGWLACLSSGSRLSLVFALVGAATAIPASASQWSRRHPVLTTLLVSAAAGIDYAAFSWMNGFPVFLLSSGWMWLQQWLHPAVAQWLLTGSLDDSTFKYQVHLDMHTYAAQLVFDEATPWLFGLLALHPLAYLPAAAVALAASPAHALLAGFTLVTCLSAGTQLRDWTVVVSFLALLFRQNMFRERRWGTALAACLHFASSVLFGFTQYLWMDRRTGNPNFIFFQADILIFTSFVMVTRVLVDYMHEATLNKWLHEYEASSQAQHNLQQSPGEAAPPKKKS